MIEELIGTASHAEGRAWSLWTLAAINALDEKHLLKGLSDEDASVAEVAVRLSETWLKRSKPVRDTVLALSKSSDARLRFCVALAIGDLKGTEVVEALARIARHGSDDVWTRRAIATALPETATAVTHVLLARTSASGAIDDDGLRSLLTELCELIGRSKDDTWAQAIFVALTDTGEWADDAARRNGVAAMTGLARGLAAAGRPLAGWMSSRPAHLKKNVERAHRLFAGTVRDAMSADASSVQRGEAIAFLRYGNWDNVGSTLLTLATGNEPDDIKRDALAALRAFSATEISEQLLAVFNSQTPAVRRTTLDLLLVRPAWCQALLVALEAGDIDRGEFDPLRSSRLTDHKDTTIRDQARKLLTRKTAADRAAVVAQYSKALELPADTLRGREVFKKNCASCHRVAGVGVNVAPDIADSYNKKLPQLLTDILDPNRAIDSNYMSFTVVTVDGQILTGIIASETATSITLRQQEDRKVSLLRDDIDELRPNGLSLMPEGLEQNISPQQMADVIRFIKNWRYLDSNIPLEE